MSSYWAMQALHAIVMLGVLWAIVWAYRFVRSRSVWASRVMAATILIRATSGVALFLVSLYQLPVLERLQIAGGFWSFAPDGRGYYDRAAVALTRGLSVITDFDPSPTYLRTLAIWMHMVGMSPGSGMLLNLVLYVAVAVMLTYAFIPSARGNDPRSNLRGGRPDSALMISVTAVSLSPILLIHSTQPLKDDLFTAVLIAGSLAFARCVQGLAGERFALTALVTGSLAIFVESGIRAYIPPISWAALAATIAVTAFQRWPAPRIFFWRSAALLLVVWAAYALGSGPYYIGYHRRTPVASLEAARAGFDRAGGATIIRPAFGMTSTSIDLLKTTELGAFGMLVMFVPTSILNVAGIVATGGSRGSLALADIDTVFVDTIIVVAVVFVWPRWRRGQVRTSVALFLVLAAVGTAIPMAAVVTNLGTLIRLRLMAVIPIWLLPIAVPASDGDAVACAAAREELASAHSHS